MRKTSLLVLTGAATTIAAPAMADTIDLTVTLPRPSVAEYHRPYVAIWLEGATGQPFKTLAVWYDSDNREGHGTKWLSDMRTWWRKGGRSAQIDGISGATRAPGPQKLTIPAAALRGLPGGQYKLTVEAARESGGRESVTVPVTLGGKRPATTSAKGATELGTVTASVKP
ncbi:DUF2271 domain-containing protein [Novosphingobium sp. 9]|uniref:DUF2271 domain-containing protein n=1 Tax=Novosphingobium sp. 9 TaxID=2025349 RepID=UPI0021B691E3|nr:DUF2271 domain-containing protein [Novosphingobium sp. 9]